MEYILSLDSNQLEVVNRVAQVLSGQAVVCLPSDTCYGLTSLATSKLATVRLKRLKWRNEDKPFILLIPATCEAENYVAEWSTTADVLARTFWPGPLTMIFPFHQRTKPPICHSRPKIALRVPDSSLLNRVMLQLRLPIWSTSANTPGCEPAARFEDIPDEIIRAVDLAIDGGELPRPTPSTIINLSGETVTIVREGLVKREDIMAKTDVNVSNSVFNR